MTRLADRFRLIAPDLCGFGAATNLPAPSAHRIMLQISWTW